MQENTGRGWWTYGREVNGMVNTVDRKKGEVLTSLKSSSTRGSKRRSPSGMRGWTRQRSRGLWPWGTTPLPGWKTG